MKSPAEIRTVAARRFKASCRKWLGAHLGLPDDSLWPLRLSLGMPSEREVLADPRRVLGWRDDWAAEAARAESG